MIIDKLAWLNISNNKLLVARSKGKDLFYVPGGKREQGESDGQALLREIQEEVSVTLLTDTIKYANTFVATADGKQSETQVKMTCYFAQYDGELSPDAEIEAIEYLSYQDKAQGSAATIQVMDWLHSQSLI